MKKRTFKTQTLINLAVSLFLFLFLIFLMVKREPLDPCDCVELMVDRPGSSLIEGEVSQLKYQTKLTEEQFQKQLDCEKEFQNYGRVNSLCNQKTIDKGN
jgi:hypothetical protein